MRTPVLAAIVLLLAGCLDSGRGGYVGASLSNGAPHEATPLDVWPQASALALAWRSDARLLGVSDTPLSPEKHKVPAFDGLSPEWQFAFATVDLQHALIVTLSGAGSLISRHETDPHPQPGDSIPVTLPLAQAPIYLDTREMARVLAQNATLASRFAGDGLPNYVMQGSGVPGDATERWMVRFQSANLTLEATFLMPGWRVAALAVGG